MYSPLVELRLSVADKVVAWTGSEPDNGYMRLRAALGYRDALAMVRAHDAGDPELRRVFEMLAGEHGYALWKALLAKKGEVST